MILAKLSENNGFNNGKSIIFQHFTLFFVLDLFQTIRMYEAATKNFSKAIRVMIERKFKFYSSNCVYTYQIVDQILPIQIRTQYLFYNTYHRK